MNPLDPGHTALLADLPQLLSAAACWHDDVDGRATFEVSLGSLPPDRGFIVAAGLEQIVRYLLDMRFHADDVSFVRNLFVFHTIPAPFWDWLESAHFRGDVWAAPEGTPIFPGEPIVRITAELPEALIVSSYILGIVGQQSLVATQTARLVQAAAGRPVVEASIRHGQGPAAAPLAARAAYIAGAAGTTCLHAARELGIPVHGSMHESFPPMFDQDADALARYLESYPVAATVVIDARDVEQSARKISELEGIRAVRLTGGDLARNAAAVRSILDDGGRSEVRITIADDLDEHQIAELVAANAAISSFEVSRALISPADVAGLDLRYELVDIERGGQHSPRLRAGIEADGRPGIKQIWRRFGTDDEATGDTLGLADESRPGAPVLSQILTAGKSTSGRPGLETIRTYTARAIGRLSSEVRTLREPASYDVSPSDELVALRDRLDKGVPA